MNIRLYTLITIFSLTAAASAAQDDGRVDYAARQYLGNVAYGSESPVSLRYMPIADLADIHVGFGHADGDFHLVDEPRSINTWIASFSGIKRVGKVTFGGGLVYENSTLFDRRWNNTLFVSPSNPYIIGDSVKSRYNNEIFRLDGSAAYSLSDRLTLALGAVYKVGSSATQKDPRPEIKGMRFRLTPGVEYRLGRHTIGASANVEWLSEEVSHTVLRTTTRQYVFLFQGLGVYELKDAIGYTRKYDGVRYGAQLQYSYDNSPDSRLSDFLQIGYYNEYEDAEDGGSNIKYKGGRYVGKGFSILERLMLRVSDRTIHNFTINGVMTDSEGRWYTQRSGTDADGNLIYEVINEACNLESHLMEAQVAYRFDRLGRSGLPVLQAEITAGVETSEKKNKIYAAKESYTNALVAASVTKRFPVRKGWIAATLDGGCRMSLDSKLNLKGMPDTYAKMMSVYTRPQFETLTSGLWHAGGGVTYSLPMAFMGYKTALEISVKCDYVKSDRNAAYGDNSRFDIGARVGFVF